MCSSFPPFVHIIFSLFTFCLNQEERKKGNNEPSRGRASFIMYNHSHKQQPTTWNLICNVKYNVFRGKKLPKVEKQTHSHTTIITTIRSEWKKKELKSFIEYEIDFKAKTELFKLYNGLNNSWISILKWKIMFQKLIVYTPQRALSYTSSRLINLRSSKWRFSSFLSHFH